ncbi:hypothetical protein Mapa_007243 [Marchantia paleacea]|nr:hypothetical protein Mapa_007243 [Marchantia paleacea]
MDCNALLLTGDDSWLPQRSEECGDDSREANDDNNLCHEKQKRVMQWVVPGNYTHRGNTRLLRCFCCGVRHLPQSIDRSVLVSQYIPRTIVSSNSSPR